MEEQDIPEQVLGLLNQCLSNIEIRGYYPSDQLNGKGSPYAEHTAKANELHNGYKLLSGENILLDYQIQMLEDELDEWQSADALYQVSDNRKLIGDAYEILGDIYYYKKHDLSKALEYYTEAFGAFLCAYRTCIAEGANDKALQKILDCLTNTSDKLKMHSDKDKREPTMAPIVLNALKLL